ncbi:MAG: YitT family protein [Zhenhengia sp.]
MNFQKILFIIILNILGTISYALGINCFAAPHHIAPGGACSSLLRCF